jgi:AcrR family transcriptional regulator
VEAAGVQGDIRDLTVSKGVVFSRPMSTGNRITGRPRDRRADEAILRAALELLAERGPHAFRIDDVAERARVGKATIYRRYESKEQLVAAAVGGLVSEIALPDTGSTRGDLLSLMHDAVAVYSRPFAAGLMASLVEGMRRDDALAEAVRGGFLAARRAALKTVLERGIARGELRPDVDTELALDVLGGPLFYRLLITGGAIDLGLAEGVVELVLVGFGTTTDTTRGRSRR